MWALPNHVVVRLPGEPIQGANYQRQVRVRRAASLLSASGVTPGAQKRGVEPEDTIVQYKCVRTSEIYRPFGVSEDVLRCAVVI